MWYADLSCGVSHTVICETLFFLIKDQQEQFITIFTHHLKDDVNFFNKLNHDSLILNTVLLSEYCKGMPTLDKTAVLKTAGTLSGIFNSVLSLSGKDRLSAFDVYVYLSIFLILEELKMKNQIRFILPGIGTKSGGKVFEILQGSMIVLDPLIPAVTEMCAALIYYYRDLLCVSVEGSLNSYIEINDPQYKNIGVKLFQCEEINSSLNKNGFEYDIVYVLETNIDDTTPEIISGVMMKVLESGALDYTITPVMMKKGRNGFFIQVLCNNNNKNQIAEMLLYQTSTFGLRMYPCLRKKIQREMKEIKTEYGAVKVKIGYKGSDVIKAVPEFDDLVLISKKRNISLFNLYNEIMREIKKRIDCF